MKKRTGYRNNNFSELGAEHATLKETLEQEIIENNNSDMIDDILMTCHKKLKKEDIDLENNQLIQNLYKVIQETLNTTNELYSVWLCDKPEQVKQNFWHNESEDTITTYEIPHDSLCICDLEEEGKLFVIPSKRKNYTKE